MKRFYIDFMGKRNILFIISGIVLTIAIAALLFRGLNLGIEFKGGTVITFVNAKNVTIEQVRKAASDAGIEAAPQSTSDGFIIRSSQTDTTKAQEYGTKMRAALKIAEADMQVSTIGPEWGDNITNKAMLALSVSIMAILVYISVRFEYKMAVTGVIALFHDAIITLGIYALVGREVTPNTVAALLTILGYSLYDTIVVFHRIRENTASLTKTTFMEMANDSLNQVLARWVNTGLSSLIPVLCLLVFGGETLKDFAFALSVGLVSGAYSSVAVASPLYAVWKEREPRYQALKKRFANR
ncbi:MAG: protein translocase subunit SecF [Coriobacteriia bacterium]|nr:protein translocase subunit SecF [Coriobacteriia bacterium]